MSNLNKSQVYIGGYQNFLTDREKDNSALGRSKYPLATVAVFAGSNNKWNSLFYTALISYEFTILNAVRSIEIRVLKNGKV